MAKKVENKDIFGGNLFKGDVVKDAEGFLKILDEMEIGFKKVATARQEALNREDQKTIQSVQRTKVEIEKLNEVERISSKVSKEKLRLNDKLKASRTKQSQQNEVIKQQIAFENKERRKLAKETLGLVGAYTKESQKLNDLRKKYKDLAISEKGVSKEQKQLLSEITQLDSKIKKIDKSVGQSQRNVGNYGSAWGKLGTILKTGLGIVGVTGLIFGIGRALKDAFGRIREFDKEMQNLAGISGKTRKELEPTEKTIKRVAGSSIKTSNEVAKLATTLTALGKSQSDVRKLLKPTNDLSIALGATSDDAGELLVSTLNAFGKGSEEGQHFADVIAKMRTSTSLDFERIKDSLGFVSATANVLNLTVGETGALIGVLQDNGVKAARAGRLLNSSFIKLAKEGKTLEGSLDRINEAQKRGVKGTELLRIAEKDFGTQSASLGVILANNRDKVAELANEFDNLSEGSLKKLTDEQLQSMDAKIKILDSTWEKLVLSVGEGDGVLSNIFKGAIEGATNFIETLTKANRTYDEIIKSVTEKNLSETEILDINEFKEFLKVTGRLKQTEEERRKTALRFLKVDLDQLEVLKNKRKQNGVLNKQDRDRLLLLGTRVRAILNLKGEQKKLNDEDEISLGNGTKKIQQSKELNGLIEKQSKVVSDLNTEIQRATSEEDIFDLSNKVDVAQKELDRLNRIVSSSREEFDKRSISLIQDDIDRTIAAEKAKSEAVLKQIRSNATTTITEKQTLIALETKRLDDFTRAQELKREQERIKRETEFFKASIDQKRTGFETEKEFEEFKAKQLQGARIDAIKQEIAALKKFGDEKSDLRIAQLNAELEGFNEFKKESESLFVDFVSVIGDLLDEAFTKRIEAIGEALNKTGERVDQLRNKAAEGQLTAEESLAFEQKKERELELQRERERKRQERTQAFFTVLSTFQSNVASGSATPLQDTIRDVGVLKALASSFGSAFDGVDDTGGRGTIDSKGGKPWILHPHEQVYSKKDRKDLGFRSREEVKEIVRKYDSGMLQDLMAHDVSNDFMNPGAFVLNGLDNSKAVINKLDELNKSILSNQPISGSVNIDEVKKVIEYTYKKGNNIVKEKSRLFGN